MEGYYLINKGSYDEKEPKMISKDLKMAEEYVKMQNKLINESYYEYNIEGWEPYKTIPILEQKHIDAVQKKIDVEEELKIKRKKRSKCPTCGKTRVKTWIACPYCGGKLPEWVKI